MPRIPQTWKAAIDYAAAQSDATVIAAPGAGFRRVMTWLCISNGAVAGKITLLDGAGGSLVFGPVFAAINGGVALDGLSIELSENTLLALTSVTVGTHGISAGGYDEAV